MTQRCNWTISWVGRCQTEVEDGPYCPKHRHACRSCGATADHDCETTVGALVCGVPLCASCRHDTDDTWAFRHAPRPNIPAGQPCPLHAECEHRDHLCPSETNGRTSDVYCKLVREQGR